MARTSVSIEIAQPAQEVFAYMADLANMTEWTDMQRMDVDGPLRTGTTGRFDLPMLGRRRTFPFVITAFEDGRRWAIRVTNQLGIAFDYRLLPTAGGTRIEEGIEVNPSGLLRLLTPLMTSMIRAEELGELRRLKAILEAPSARH